MLNKPFSDFTQKFRCYAKVGGDLYIGDAIEQLWIGGEKIQVAFLCSGTDILKHPLLEVDKSVLNQHPEIPVEFGVMGIKVEQIGFGNLQQLRLFQCLYVKLGRGVCMKTANVSDPLILNGKLEIVFLPFFIHLIHLQTAMDNKGVMRANITLLQNELPSFHPLGCYPGLKLLNLRIVERKVVGKMGNERIDLHGQWSGAVLFRMGKKHVRKQKGKNCVNSGYNQDERGA